jgi:hypothetical protein
MLPYVNISKLLGLFPNTGYPVAPVIVGSYSRAGIRSLHLKVEK